MPDKRRRAEELLRASNTLAQATGYQPTGAPAAAELVVEDDPPATTAPEAVAPLEPEAPPAEPPASDSPKKEKPARPEAFGFSVPAAVAESDKQVMVGARVPEPMRAAIRTACAIHGMDVQTFCQIAFERELKRLARQG